MDIAVKKRRNGPTVIRIEVPIREAIVLRDAVEVYAQTRDNTEAIEF